MQVSSSSRASSNGMDAWGSKQQTQQQEIEQRYEEVEKRLLGLSA
jgi:hypothetical protein